MDKLKKPLATFNISLEMEPIKLPPVRDILVLGKKYPQGKEGVIQCFRFIAPDEFEMFDVENIENVEAIMVSKKVLKRFSFRQLMTILSEYVFPYMSKDEAIKVNINSQLFFTGIRGELDHDHSTGD